MIRLGDPIVVIADEEGIPQILEKVPAEEDERKESYPIPSNVEVIYGFDEERGVTVLKGLKKI